MSRWAVCVTANIRKAASFVMLTTHVQREDCRIACKIEATFGLAAQTQVTGCQTHPL